MSIKHFILIAIVIVVQARSSSSQCIDRTSKNGTISNFFTVDGYVIFNRCWKISNLEKKLIILNITSISNTGFDGEACNKGNVTITLRRESRVWTFCSIKHLERPLITFGDIEIKHFINSSRYSNGYRPNFTLVFESRNISKDIFPVARLKAVSWLYNQRSPLWDWRENTLKAVTVLHLSGATHLSNGTALSDELMLKQAEYRVAISLQRDDLTEIDLSTFIHFLLVTCNSPRNFAYHDFIKHLKHKIESSGNLTHPIAYLALCNANETWPSRAINDLSNVLNNVSEYSFVKDIQAFAVMAIACKINKKTGFETSTENTNLIALLNKGIEKIHTKLNQDDVKTASEISLLTQAILSVKEEETFAIYNLLSDFESSRFDFQNIYFTLPILSGKSLSDIFKTNCSGNIRRGISDTSRRKPTIQVPYKKIRYSLFIGDKKEIIHTTSISLPKNYTAFHVMELAELRNPMFQFKWHRESGKVVIYDIAETANDPETSKFWLLYLGSNNKEFLIPMTKGPDEIYLRSEDHLIMWYKTTRI